MTSFENVEEKGVATKKTAATKKSGAKYKAGETRIAKKDIDAVAQKLEGFVKDLPKQEQDVLGWILTRAQAAPPAELAAAAASAGQDAPGLRTPLATQLARSVGFLRPAQHVDVTVVVGWQYRFGLVDPGSQFTLPTARK